MKERWTRFWPGVLATILILSTLGASQIRAIDSLVGITSAGQAVKADSLPVAIASDQDYLTVTVSNFVSTLKAYHMAEGGATEIVGADEQVDQNEYGASVAVALDTTDYDSISGEILSFGFLSTEDGTGAIQKPDGTLYIFDADPSISVGDVTMTNADWLTVMGVVRVSSSDWVTDTTGAMNYIIDTPIAFHSVITMYLAWFQEDTTSFNDNAADDEQLEMNFWYRRDR